MTDKEILKLFYGMSKTMQDAVIKIMQVTQEKAPN